MVTPFPACRWAGNLTASPHWPSIVTQSLEGEGWVGVFSSFESDEAVTKDLKKG